MKIESRGTVYEAPDIGTPVWYLAGHEGGYNTAVQHFPKFAQGKVSGIAVRERSCHVMFNYVDSCPIELCAQTFEDALDLYVDALKKHCKAVNAAEAVDKMSKSKEAKSQ